MVVWASLVRHLLVLKVVCVQHPCRGDAEVGAEDVNEHRATDVNHLSSQRTEDVNEHRATYVNHLSSQHTRTDISYNLVVAPGQQPKMPMQQFFKKHNNFVWVI